MAFLSIENYLTLLPDIQNSPDRSMWLHYDAEADTLYVNFRHPSIAVDSDLTDDDVIIRYDEQNEIVGYTILHVGQRAAGKAASA
ncbi:MAG: DUF2283 domain-containing protein [Anaerolineae bacterium]|nr:DUF2283 domain-containing protein [Anaerolineae bacterium]